jgi:hypothetical protein
MSKFTCVDIADIADIADNAEQLPLSLQLETVM